MKESVMNSTAMEIDHKLKCGSTFHELLDNFDSDSTTKIVSFVNPFSYLQLLDFSNLVRSVDCFFSDGFLLCFLNKFFNGRKIVRASFDYSSIAVDVFKYAELNGAKIAFVGATSEEISDAVVNIIKSFPKLDVVYYRDGFFESHLGEACVVEQVKKSNCQILVVGMGTPYQEKFCSSVKAEIKNGLLIFTCGGFLTQTAMKGDYYHPLVKKFGLRWLQRAILHKHVRQRIFRDYPVFVFSYVFSRLKAK